MIYALFIWTAVTAAPARTNFDWRQLAEFQTSTSIKADYDAQAKCEAAAKELNLESKFYRCVKTK